MNDLLSPILRCAGAGCGERSRRNVHALLDLATQSTQPQTIISLDMYKESHQMRKKARHPLKLIFSKQLENISIYTIEPLSLPFFLHLHLPLHTASRLEKAVLLLSPSTWEQRQFSICT